MSSGVRRLRAEVHWWARWLVRYFPGLLVKRVWHCRRKHVGPMYDGWICLTCGAPWMGRR